MGYAIYKFINDISLNGREYVLDAPDGDVMIFGKQEDAISYIKKAFKDMPDDEEGLEKRGIYLEPYWYGLANSKENDDA